MKKRMGFVSNSSSSSFICDLTGRIESGMDCSLTDIGMVECVKGHTFNYEGFSEVEAWVATSEEDDDDGASPKEANGGYVYNSEVNYNMPSKYCPICQKDKKAMKMMATRIKTEMDRLGISNSDLAD